MKRQTEYGQRFNSLVRKMKDSISEREIFCSPEFSRYMSDTSHNIITGTGEYLRRQGFKVSDEDINSRAQKRVRVVWMPKNPSGWTDNTEIAINPPGLCSASSADFRDKVLEAYATLAHECGHVIFTDFIAFRKWLTMMQAGQFWPANPKGYSNSTLKWMMSRPLYRNFIVSQAKDIQNCLEDGYIEMELRMEFPGTVASSLDYAAEMLYDQGPSFAKAVASQNGSLYVAIRNEILSYAVCHRKKLGGYTGPYMEVLKKVYPIVDKSRRERNPELRYQAANELMVLLAEALKKDIDDAAKQLQQQQQGQGGQSGDSGQPSSTSNGSGESSQGQSSDGQNDQQEGSGNEGSSKGNEQASSGASGKSQDEGEEQTSPSDASGENQSENDGQEQEAPSGEDKGDGKGQSSPSDTSGEGQGDNDGQEQKASSGGSQGGTEEPSSSSTNASGEGQSDNDGEKQMASADSAGKNNDEGGKSQGSQPGGSPGGNSIGNGSAQDGSQGSANGGTNGSSEDGWKSNLSNRDLENISGSVVNSVIDNINNGVGDREYSTESNLGTHSILSSDCNGDKGEIPEEEHNNGKPDKGSADEQMEQLIDKLKEQIAQDRVEETLEKERLRRMRGECQLNLKRPISVSDVMVQQYWLYAHEVLPVSRRLQKDILQLFEDRRTGSTNRNLFMGQRFEAGKVVNKSGRYFCKRNLPTGSPKMRVDVLVDESMSTSGNTNVAFIKTCIAIEDFCRSLEIESRIMGYTENNGIEIDLFVEPDKIGRSNSDRFRLVGITPSGNTPTYTALEYALKDLYDSPQEYKMILVLTDGCGNDGKSTHIKSLIRAATRKGVNVFAAGVGSDKPRIEMEFGKDNFLNIGELETMPKRMCNLIRKTIL